MKTKGAGSEGGMPTTTIVIIAIIIMLVASALIFLALPYLEDEFGEPGLCEDTGYHKDPGTITDRYVDNDHLNRYIIKWHDGNDWQYHDGYEGFVSVKFDTLHKLRQATQAEYEGGSLSEASWHWFDCTAEAIS